MTPELIYNSFEVKPDYVNKRLGIDLTLQQQMENCEKMGHKAVRIDETSYRVTVSPVWADVLHACDICEDVGVAFGYNNIPRVVPTTNTVGKLLTINKFSDLLRHEIAQAGFLEILTSGLVSWKENFDFLRVPFESGRAVILANSKTKEFDTVRSLLLPGLLKTLFSNKSERLPHKIFEVADVCVIDPTTDTGARNARHICVLYADNSKTGMEIIHGVLDSIMRNFGVPYNQETGGNDGYSIKESTHPTFFEKR